MQWSLRQKGWRALGVRTALLTALWLAVAFVFAAELYLSASGLPVKISWLDAAGSAFRDWFPWMLLSPVAVFLAGRYRFDGGDRRRSLVIHFTACCLFTVAYTGLFYLAFPAPFMLSSSGVGLSTATFAAPSGMQSFGVVRGGDAPPQPVTLPPGANITGMAGAARLGPGGVSLPGSTVSNAMLVVSVDGHAPFSPRLNALVTGFPGFPTFNPWTQFLHMAMMKTQFTIPIYLCIISICWVLNHFQEAGERERRTLELETRLTQANLRTLKMQLQPHFLFNTLNAISSLVHENPRAADDMIGSLSQFLRTTLDVSTQDEVPLRQELDFVDRYLEIQKTRFGDRLQIHMEVDTGVLEALVPPLILQPLVENAIRYGIEARETGGNVTIRASRAQAALQLEISDDGDGFKGGQLLGLQNGIGLSNTKSRLQELYGDQHQFKLTANQPAGARVFIEIPLRIPASNTHNKP
jgi:two-component sensor histidine kinase